MKLKEIKDELRAVSGIFVNTWRFLFAPITRPTFFHGYTHYYFAKKFAEKRTRRYKGYDQNGKVHAVFPFNDIDLVVLNKIELKALKKRYKTLSWMALKMNPRKYIKRNSYYKTEYK